MMWPSFISSLSSIATWIKENCQIPFLAVWTLFIWVFTRRNSEAAIETIKIKDAAHKEEIKTLKQSHSEEVAAKDELTKEYLKIVDQIEKKGRSFKIALAEQEKQKVKQIVEDSRGDGHEIKKQLKEKFGFNYVD